MKPGKALASVFMRCVLYAVVFVALSVLKESETVQALAEKSEAMQYFQHWFFRLAIGLVSVSLAMTMLPLDIRSSKVLAVVAGRSYMIYIVHYFLLVGFVTLFPEVVVSLWGVLAGWFPLLLSVVVMAVSLLVAMAAGRLPLLRSL